MSCTHVYHTIIKTTGKKWMRHLIHYFSALKDCVFIFLFFILLCNILKICGRSDNLSHVVDYKRKLIFYAMRPVGTCMLTNNDIMSLLRRFHLLRWGYIFFVSGALANVLKPCTFIMYTHSLSVYDEFICVFNVTLHLIWSACNKLSQRNKTCTVNDFELLRGV